MGIFMSDRAYYTLLIFMGRGRFRYFLEISQKNASIIDILL
jgi:hypothetical protein